MNNRVVIVVKGGRVYEVYAKDSAVDIEIIDCDTDDPCRAAEAEEALKEVKSDKLVCVY